MVSQAARQRLAVAIEVGDVEAARIALNDIAMVNERWAEARQVGIKARMKAQGRWKGLPDLAESEIFLVEGHVPGSCRGNPILAGTPEAEARGYYIEKFTQ